MHNLKSNLNSIEYSNRAIVYIDKIYQPLGYPSDSGWYSFGCLINPDSNSLVCASIIIPYKARICITDDRVIRKMHGAQTLVGKTILPPTYNDLLEQSVEIPDNVTVKSTWFRNASPQEVGFQNKSDYDLFWNTGEVYTRPHKSFISVYKFFRDVSAKSCPSLKQDAIASDQSGDDQSCDSC